MTSRFKFITNTKCKNAVINKSVKYSSTSSTNPREIPSAKGLPVIGTTLSLIAAGSTPRLHVYVDNRHKQLGPIFKDKIGPVSAIFIADPEQMRAVFAQEGRYPHHVVPEAWVLYNELYTCSRGLFFMNNEEWLLYRKIMNKLLLKENSDWIERACHVVSTNTVAQWEKLNRNCEYFPHLESELYKWSIDVVISILIGHEAFKEANEILRPLLNRLASVVHLVFQTTANLSLIPARFAAKYRIPSWKRFVNSVDEALNTGNELVSVLLDEYPKTNGLLSKLKRENIFRAEIIRIAVDLVLAAGDTTAYSMEWILYLISKNKEVQERLAAELRTNENPVLLKNVIREALRLYPVAPFLTRILSQSASIGGYEVPPGTLILLSIYSSGRDPKYFKSPEKFWPDRWLRDGGGNLKMMQQASLPFAMGARSCIGRKIAETQLQVGLAYIIQKFRLELQNTKDVEMVLKMVAVPSENIRLKLTKR